MTAYLAKSRNHQKSQMCNVPFLRYVPYTAAKVNSITVAKATAERQSQYFLRI